MNKGPSAIIIYSEDLEKGIWFAEEILQRQEGIWHHSSIPSSLPLSILFLLPSLLTSVYPLPPSLSPYLCLSSSSFPSSLPLSILFLLPSLPTSVYPLPLPLSVYVPFSLFTLPLPMWWICTVWSKFVVVLCVVSSLCVCLCVWCLFVVCVYSTNEGLVINVCGLLAYHSQHGLSDDRSWFDRVCVCVCLFTLDCESAPSSTPPSVYSNT